MLSLCFSATSSFEHSLLILDFFEVFFRIGDHYAGIIDWMIRIKSGKSTRNEHLLFGFQICISAIVDIINN